MGQAVIVACPLPLDLGLLDPILRRIAADTGSRVQSVSTQQFQEMAREWGVDSPARGAELQLMTDEQSWPLIVSDSGADPERAEDYATNEDLDERFRREIRGLRFFTVRFRDVDLTRRFLREVALQAVSRRDVVWFDTDWGWVISAADFLRRTDEDTRWDWRYAADQEVHRVDQPSLEERDLRAIAHALRDQVRPPTGWQPSSDGDPPVQQSFEAGLRPLRHVDVDCSEIHTERDFHERMLAWMVREDSPYGYNLDAWWDWLTTQGPTELLVRNIQVLHERLPTAAPTIERLLRGWEAVSGNGSRAVIAPPDSSG